MAFKETSRQGDKEQAELAKLELMDKSMRFEELFSDSFQHLRASFLTSEQLLRPMVGKMLSTDSRFCQEAVAARLVSQEDMQRAARRYLLGRSRNNETVFWMIDERQRVRDGMVGDTWASVLLKERGLIDRQWCPRHCLFGLHLLGHTEITEITEMTPSEYGAHSKKSVRQSCVPAVASGKAERRSV